MNSTAEQVPLSSERLPDESARAYRAYCIYQNLGANRSLDRAWRCFCASSDQGESGRSARRPGNWAAWSKKFDWVERARFDDDLIERNRRIAAAVARQELQDKRTQFEIEIQVETQKMVRLLDSLMERSAGAPLSEVTQVKTDNVTGVKTTTKIKPPNLGGLGTLLKARNESARLAILGTYDLKDREAETRKAERIVWAEDKNRDPVIDNRSESDEGDRQAIADLASYPTD